LSYRLKGFTQRPRILYGIGEKDGRPIFLQAQIMALGGDDLPDNSLYDKEKLIELIYVITFNSSWR